MKLQITLALAAVCVTNAGRVQKDAEKFLANVKNPISVANQKKLENAAKVNLDKYTNLAEQEAAKHGVHFDLSAIYTQLGNDFGQDVVQRNVEKATKNVEARMEARREQFESNPNVAEAKKSVRKFANKATFAGQLKNIKNLLSAQANKIPNKTVAKELNKMLAEGAKEARNQMKNANVDINMNIKNTGAKFVKNNQAGWEAEFVAQQKNMEKTLKEKLNQGIRNL
jgi:hypothetical protein